MRRAVERRVLFEVLDSRDLLATLTWDGGGANGNWLTAANWVGDIAPSAGDNLVFTGNVRTTNVNNFPNGTSFDSISFDSGAGSFSISGNQVVLNGGVDISVLAGTQSLAIPLSLASSSELNVSADSLLLSGNISGVGSLVKTGSAGFTLSGSNTFAAGVQVKAGTVTSGSAAAFGSGTITLGDTTGSANATVMQGFAGTHTNPISVSSGNTGLATVASSQAGGFSGAITLNSHDVTILATNGTFTVGAVSGTGTATTKANGGAIALGAFNPAGSLINAGTGAFTVSSSAAIGTNVTSLVQNSATSATNFTGTLTVNSGGTTLVNNSAAQLKVTAVTGTGNLTLQNNGTMTGGGILVNGATNNIGTVTNSGSGTGDATLAGVIGANVTKVIQNSPTSTLTLSGANTTFASGLWVKAGIAASATSASAFGTAAITLGDTTGSASATVRQGFLGTHTNPISVSSGNTGVATIASNLASGTGTFTGAITLNSHDVVLATLGVGALSVNTISGTGNVTGKANGGNITLATAVNHNGNLINEGTGSGSLLNSAGIGTNVTSLVQNSATSAMNFTGTLTVNSGGTTLANNSAAQLKVTAVAGTGNLTLQNNGTMTGGGILVNGATNNIGTITNSGSGTGDATLAGVIGANVTKVIQNSPTSTLTLSGANTTFASGLWVKAGIAASATSASAFGTAAITLGDTTGSANATVLQGFLGTHTNPISVSSGNTGVATIASNLASGTGTFTGAITLNSHDVVLATMGVGALSVNTISGTGNVTGKANGGNITLATSVNHTGSLINAGTGSGSLLNSAGIGSNVTSLVQNSASSAMNFTGTLTVNSGGTTLVNNSAAQLKVTAVTGTGNLTLQNNGTMTGGGILVNGATNNIGTITNSGSGTGDATLAGVIGANVTKVIQNSPTSTLTLSGANTTFASGLWVKAGIAASATSASAFGTAAITLGDTTGSASATVRQGFLGTHTNPISVSSGNTGVATIASNLASGTGTFTGAITLNSHDVVLATMGVGALSVNTISGTGNVTGKANGGNITLATAVNHNGNLINEGTGSGSLLNSAGIGTNVTSLVQNSATSAMNFTGTLTVNSGGTTLAKNSTAQMTVTAVTGTGNLILQNNGFSGGILVNGATNNVGTITNSGTGVSSSTLAGAVGTNVTGVIQNSVTSGLTLSGANTFTTGVQIKAGTVTSGSASAFGTGAITLGNTTGSANATVLQGVAATHSNPISVSSGNTGLATIATSLAGGFSGAITLNSHDVTILATNGTFTVGAVSGTGTATTKANGGAIVLGAFSPAGGLINAGTGAFTVSSSAAIGTNVTSLVQNSATSAMNFTGTLTVNSGGTTLVNNSSAQLKVTAVAGTGNLALQNNGTMTGGGILVNGATNNIGTITNSGSGTGDATLAGVIGANVTKVIQNSPTSTLTLSGANVAFAGGLWVKAGTATSATSANAFGTAAITLGDTTGTADVTLIQVDSIANPVIVAGGNTGTATLFKPYVGTTTLNGGVTLDSHDLTITAINSGISSYTITDISGTGNLYINSAGTRIELAGTINHHGSITNNSTHGLTRVQGTLGSNVTALVQNTPDCDIEVLAANSHQSTYVNAGLLTIGHHAALGTASSTLTVDGGSAEVDLNAESIVLGSVNLKAGIISDGVIQASTFIAESGTLSATLFGPSNTLTKTGAGTVYLTSANNHNGGTFVLEGTLLLSGTGRFGGVGAALVVDGGSAIADLGSLTRTSGLVTVKNGGSLLNGILTATSVALEEGFVGAVLAGASTALTKSTSGVAVLAGANTYGGTTTVSGGTLLVDGSLANGVAAIDVSIASGATLGGNGSILGVVSVSGTLAPGSGVGILSTARIAFANDSTYSVELDGTTPGTGTSHHDQLTVTNNSAGSTTIGTNVSLSISTPSGYLPSYNDVFTIVNNSTAGGSVSGTFDGLPEGTVFLSSIGKFQISYIGGSGNDITIKYLEQYTVAIDGDELIVTAEALGAHLTFTTVDVGGIPYIAVNGTPIVATSAITQLTVLGTEDNDVFELGGLDESDFGTFSTLIDGAGGNDLIHGSFAVDLINGSDGEDEIYGGGGNDVMAGGGGDDFIYGEQGDDILNGEGGNDTINGGSEFDFIEGGTGADTLTGGLGSDTILGGSGDDTIHGSEGDDTLYGGNDNDQLFGDTGDDDLVGESGDDTLSGGDGGDIVAGGEGNDALYGDGDNDALNGGNGNDAIHGGLGHDTLEGGAGNDLGYGDAGFDLLLGNGGNDFLSGGDDADEIHGDAGNDVLQGGEGNDTVQGEDGDDSLDGGNGDDNLAGEAGNDALAGSDGNDSLSGGAGNDYLNGGDGDDSQAGGGGIDANDGGSGNNEYQDDGGGYEWLDKSGSGTGERALYDSDPCPDCPPAPEGTGANTAGGRGYNSKDNPHPIIAQNVIFAASALSSSLIKVNLTLADLVIDTVYYDPASIVPDEPMRISFVVDASTLEASRYRWTMTVTEDYPSLPDVVRTFDGYQDIVNRIDSEFGNRWFPVDVDRIVQQENGLLLILPDNRTHWFGKQTNGTYIAEAGEIGFSVITYDSPSGQYTLTQKDNASSVFNSLGYIVSRFDTRGRETVYDYTDADGDHAENELWKRTDPYGRLTTYSYFDGLLSSTKDFAGRVTAYLYTDRLLTSVISPDPDGVGVLTSPVTTYEYDPTTSLMTSMTNPVGEVTSYDYYEDRTLSKTTYPDGSFEELSAASRKGSVVPGNLLGSLAEPASLIESSAVNGTFSDKASEERQTEFDGIGYVSKLTDALGNTSIFNRDQNGFLTEMIEPDPDGAGPQTALTTTYKYSANGNLEKQTNPDSSWRSWEYDLKWNVPTKFTDERSSITNYQIDSDTGEVLETRQIVGENDLTSLETDDVVTSYLYTEEPLLPSQPPAGLIEKVTDPRGIITEFKYTSRGLVESITRAVGTSVETSEHYTYTPSDLVETFTDALGRTTHYEYDALDRLMSATLPDPDGPGIGNPLTSPVYTYEYDGVDRQIKSVDPLGRLFESIYNDKGQLESLLAPDHDSDGNKTATKLGYDAAGRLESLTDPLGRKSSSQFDALGRVTKQLEPSPDGVTPGPKFETEYGATGWILSTKDALGNETLYEYADYGNTVTIKPPHPVTGLAGAGPATTYTYDSLGNLTKVIDPLGHETTYSYDELNRLISETQPDPDGVGGLKAPVTKYSYDANGNLTSVTEPSNADPSSAITLYTYDELNRLTKTTLPDPDDAGPLDTPVTEYTYDLGSQLRFVEDPLQRVTEYGYDLLGRLTQITLPDPDAAGPLTSPEYGYSYDAVGRRISEIDPLNNITEYKYDALDNLIELKQPDPDGVGALLSPVTTWSYDAGGQLLSATDPLERTTLYDYDKLGRRTKVTLPDPDGIGPLASPIELFAYDISGNLIKTTDALNRETDYEYDKLYRQIKVELPSPDGILPRPTYTFEFDAASRLTKAVDPLERATAFAYDGLDRLVSKKLFHEDTAPGRLNAPEFVYGYDDSLNLVTETDPREHTTTFTFDNLHRQIKVTQPAPSIGEPLAAPVWEYSYDSANQLKTSTDPNERVTSYLYDDLGRLISEKQPDPDGVGLLIAPDTQYTYDAAGNLKTVTNPIGKVTTYGYDNLYRRTSITDPLAGVTSFTFDVASQLLSLTDPEENTTTWDYDGLGRVAQETNQLNKSRFFKYDAVGNLTERTDRNGRVINYAYDDLDRNTTEEWYDGLTLIRTIGFEFDAADQLTEANDPSAVNSYSYDVLGRIAQEVQTFDGFADTLTFDYEYDDASNRTQSRWNFGTTEEITTDFVYDDLNRLSRLTRSSDEEATFWHRVEFGYNRLSKYTDIERFVGDSITPIAVVATSYSYDETNRLTSIQHGSGATTWAGYGYTYDAAGRILSVDSFIDGLSEYDYDDTDQLTGADHTSVTDEAYTYDSNGNRTLLGHSTGDNNQLISDGTYDYTYDDEGNRLTRTDISTGYVTEYAWDHRNRLIAVTEMDDLGVVLSAVENSYDAFNRWILREVDGDGPGGAAAVDSFFAYEGSQPTLEFAGDEGDDLSHIYSWGRNVDELIADITHGETPNFALSDHLGTPQDFVAYDSGLTGTVTTGHRMYDSFGNLASSTGISSLLGYTARPFDDATGLQNNLNRWYDPVAGRWISDDPIGFAAGDANTARYVGNTPTSFVDSNGLIERRGDILRDLGNDRNDVSGTRFDAARMQASYNDGVETAQLAQKGLATIGGFDSLIDAVELLTGRDGYDPNQRKLTGDERADRAKSLFMSFAPMPLMAGRLRGASRAAKKPPKLAAPLKAIPCPPILQKLTNHSPTNAASTLRNAADNVTDTSATLSKVGDPPAKPKDYGVRFFGEEQVKYYSGNDARLGKEGQQIFFSPVEDMGSVRNAADAAQQSGYAPSVTNAYLKDRDVYGISFPTNDLKVRQPTAADAGGWPHFLEGGNTAVRLPGENGGYMLNSTKEFVTPAGPVPSGSVLFKLGANGEWIPQRRF
ncbi:RHS repeat-associated core domain-containing protein [Anatilimnocola sp. NA78]|uniref:RHS repeat-associated core domain-containing protein n=1 Tax=Anatilimnocola sp. NA78 TaxID=3415683 RepID=UPI003CE4D406